MNIYFLDRSTRKLFPLSALLEILASVPLFLPTLHLHWLGLSSAPLSSVALVQLCLRGGPRRQHKLIEETLVAWLWALDQVLLLSEYQFPHL